tara:strand:- start:731 stop:940 length:210 start_codon:yes stop_codon:yes gene_type:complete
MAKDSDKTKEVELSEKQKYIQLHLNDLASKEKNLMFQLDQIKASQQVFNQAFVDASKEIADELLEEKAS